MVSNSRTSIMMERACLCYKVITVFFVLRIKPRSGDLCALSSLSTFQMISDNLARPVTRLENELRLPVVLVSILLTEALTLSDVYVALVPYYRNFRTIQSYLVVKSSLL